MVPKKNDRTSLSRQLILPIRRMARAHRTIRLGSTRKWINGFGRKSDTVIVDTIVPDKRVPEQRSAAIFHQSFRVRIEILKWNLYFQSEERGKDDSNKERFLRPAGSSPCVVVEGSFNVRDQVADPEQGIYHGFYRLGTWICITDRDVWRRNDFVGQDGEGEREREASIFQIQKYL